MRLGLGLGLSSGGIGSSSPVLAFNFIDADYEVNRSPVALTDYVTCTRAGTATYVNSSGVVTDATADTLRFDYAPNAGALRGLLIESGVTNLMLRTEEFNDVGWAKTRLAVTADTTLSPAGTTTADRCLCNSTGGGMYVLRASSSFSGTTFTASVWIKKGSGDWSAIQLYNGANSLIKYFNVATGAVGSHSAGGNYTFTDATITDYGGGWFRCTLTVTRPNTTANTTFLIQIGSTGDGVNDCTSGVTEGFLWGAQIEAQGIASSYVRASASSVARSSDVVSMTGTDFSDWYNASQGTFVGAFNVAATGGHLLSANDNTASEAIVSRLNAGSNHLIVTDGAVTQADINAGSFTLNATQKLAIAYKANDFAACFNGGSVVTDTSGTIPTVDRLLIGGHSGSSNYLNGHIRSLEYYSTRLSDSALQSA